ncbi:MAG: ComF family protein [Elusimicrobia bacterium]|nr:ComF family protein [Elusimicrobiota bacterium]
MKISTIKDAVLDFFFPNVCVSCGKDVDDKKSVVCRDCIDKIEYIKPPYCLTCFQPLPDGGAHCWQCRKTKYHFEKVIAVGRYTGILRKLILKFKEKDFLKTILAGLLLDTLTKNMDIESIDFIVPVPLSKRKEFERGYNQSGLLADILGKKLNKMVVSDNFIRIRNTSPQFELSREQRLINLKDSFFVRDPAEFKGKNIVIIDDIATTCLTLEESSKILKKSGAGNIHCLVLARD